MYYFWPFDPASTECCHLQNDSKWGWRPNHEGDEDKTDLQFSSAKIADSLSELGREHKLAHELELVNVVKTPMVVEADHRQESAGQSCILK